MLEGFALAESLQFARGVRLAREEDLPRPREKALARLASAAITTGYVRRTPTDKGFTDYFEINAHAADVWNLFVQLSSGLLPDVAAPLIASKDENPDFGPYTDKELAIRVFSPFAERLVHDGFIEFGAMHGHQGSTEEVLVKAHKYFCVWTSKPEVVVEILGRMRIPEVPSLQFLDEFPSVTEAINDGGLSANEVINAVKECFRVLPKR